MDTTITTVKKPMPTSRRKLLFAFGAVLLGLLLAFVLAELGFRWVEGPRQGVPQQRDARWGWKPTPGEHWQEEKEFRVPASINNDFMNDAEVNPVAEAALTRVMVLGDSHTFAMGVATTQTWAKVLEATMNQRAGSRAIRTYNAANIGYSLHQYLLRLMDQGSKLRPHYVLVGLSYATDFYDLLPADRGGWIYGGNSPRDYFDFDSEGKLALKHWTPPDAGKAQATALSYGQRVRNWLFGHSATYRRLRRSSLGLFVGSKVRIGGRPLWENMEIVMEREVSPRHDYQHRLFRALVSRLKLESQRIGAQLVLVGIPYVPQVYDRVRQTAFSGDRYDWDATSRRLESLCSELDVKFVDTIGPLRRAHERTGRWLHYPLDAHPTAEGHQIIALTVADYAGLKAQVLNPAPVASAPAKESKEGR